MNEIKSAAEMSVEAAEEFVKEAAMQGKDIKKVIIGGVLVAVVVGGTVIVIKKVKPVEKFKAFRARRKEIREARKLGKQAAEEEVCEEE